jgi:hypothetical protein
MQRPATTCSSTIGPTYRGTQGRSPAYVATLGTRLADNGHRLLPRERYSADLSSRAGGIDAVVRYR